MAEKDVRSMSAAEFAEARRRLIADELGRREAAGVAASLDRLAADKRRRLTNGSASLEELTAEIVRGGLPADEAQKLAREVLARQKAERRK